MLIAEEKFQNLKFKKFPGGGLEFGEGLADCVKRECMEETGFEVKILDHIYTTDFFQPSAFNDQHQLISVYYHVDFIESNIPERIESPEENVKLHWVELEDITEELFYFPVDKLVCSRLKFLVT